MPTMTSYRNTARAIALLSLPTAAFAAASASTGSGGGLDVWTMGMSMLGGLALFLFGMEQMSDGLKALAGDRLKDILARLTTNRYMGALTGAVVTAVIQSSSVTTVLTVGFITAGILSVSQAVGIIFGANIGTTLTAQIVAFKVTKLALLMIAGGFGLLFLSKSDTKKQYGAMIMGLGLVFFGMSVMSDAMSPLRTYQPFLDLMVKMGNPALGILVAAVFTGLVQSSSATTGVVIAMASQGLIGLDAGIALIFGANVGTCVTAMLASLGKPRNAVRASLVHVLFNIVGVLLWVGFIDQLVMLVTYLSPASEQLSGTARLAADTPRQIANAHTIFNIANTLILLPFGAQFARLVERLIPEVEEERDVVSGAAPEWTAVHLDPALLAMPSVALEQSRGELLRLGRLVHEILGDVLPAFITDDAAKADDITERGKMARSMDEQIDRYLIQVSRCNLSEEQSTFATQLLDVGTSLAHLEELLRKDFLSLMERKRDQNVGSDGFGLEGLQSYAQKVLTNMETALSAFNAGDAEMARTVVRNKPELERELRQTRAQHYDRLQDEGSDAARMSSLQLDMLDDMRRVFIYSESIALTMLHGYLDQRGGNREAA
ncbi:MAG: Na/Pi cotransporter family protein [Gemmatimonadetes bacterium]|jgi:phosphate:Na+ symporter|nr:Na/Pi cotransporter family protein [Gemmatimonadota bacterium]MBT7859549.1 Na/Pi cotransporter family protein [Gemmatimonadota bacterium]